MVLRRVKGYAPGWRVRCLACGHTRPAAEAGIIRVAAAGRKYTLGRCSACGKLRWIVIERDPSPEKDKAVSHSNRSEESGHSV